MSDIHCFYVSAGLLAPQHLKRIGRYAIWEFLWLISHETKMEGRVLNGAPITLQRIAAELGEHVNTAARNLDRLVREGYVIKKRSGPGHPYCYAIAHSKKWKAYWAQGPTTDGGTTPTTDGGTLLQSPTTDGGRVTPDMVGGPTTDGGTNKEVEKLDKVDSRSTICTKCSGRGIFSRLVPSKINPEDKVIEWVKCDCSLDRN